jgi:cell division protein FtsX
VALAFLASACGGGPSSHAGLVQVFFCTTVSMPECKADATRAQEQAVGRALRNSPDVVKATYVSKATGLRQAKKQNPDLPTVPLAVNPLPDKWVVTVMSDAQTAAVGQAICAAHYAGVERCPGASSSELGDAGGVQW